MIQKKRKQDTELSALHTNVFIWFLEIWNERFTKYFLAEFVGSVLEEGRVRLWWFPLVHSGHHGPCTVLIPLHQTLKEVSLEMHIADGIACNEPQRNTISIHAYHLQSPPSSSLSLTCDSSTLLNYGFTEYKQNNNKPGINRLTCRWNDSNYVEPCALR